MRNDSATADPPLARWEVVLLWLVGSVATFGWVAVYTVAWLLIGRVLAAVDHLADRLHEFRVRRSCRKGTNLTPRSPHG